MNRNEVATLLAELYALGAAYTEGTIQADELVAKQESLIDCF